jgi:hypothetical protein
MPRDTAVNEGATADDQDGPDAGRLIMTSEADAESLAFGTSERRLRPHRRRLSRAVRCPRRDLQSPRQQSNMPPVGGCSVIDSTSPAVRLAGAANVRVDAFGVWSLVQARRPCERLRLPGSRGAFTRQRHPCQ